MRKRTVWLLVSMMVLLAGGVTLLAGGNGAVVVKGEDCFLLNGDGTTFVESPTGGQTVSAPNGGINFVCNGSVSPSSSGTAMQWDATNATTMAPYGCCVQMDDDGDSCTLFTQDWQETVSADGQATLTCHVNGS